MSRTKGGKVIGKPHTQGGEKFEVGDSGRVVELEGDEAVINKRSMGDDTEYTVKGTPAQIASAVNANGGGVEFAKGAKLKNNQTGEVKQFQEGGELDEDMDIDENHDNQEDAQNENKDKSFFNHEFFSHYIENGALITGGYFSKSTAVMEDGGRTDGESGGEGSDASVDNGENNNEDLQSELSQFMGGDDEAYSYKFMGRPFVMTAGVSYLATHAKAYWLLNSILSYQGEKKLKSESFQTWELARVGDEGSTVFKITATDGNKNILVEEEIPYSDFPLDKVKIWLIDETLLLPNEY